MIQMEEAYRYLGVPLTSAVAEFVIVSQLGGKQLKRSQVVNFVERYHAEHGGLPCQAADIARTVKKALDTIKAKGGAQNPSVGWWRISSLIDGEGETQGESSTDGLCEGITDVSEHLTTLSEIGDGDESIYLYYYPAYKAAALASGSSKWLCKIGRTDSSASIRISSQATGMPETPEIGLVYHTNDSRALESVLHGILSLRNQWSEASPGVEWFITSPEDVTSIIEYVLQVDVGLQRHV